MSTLRDLMSADFKESSKRFNRYWQVCHQSGRVLFTSDNEVTARNGEQFGGQSG